MKNKVTPESVAKSILKTYKARYGFMFQSNLVNKLREQLPEYGFELDDKQLWNLAKKTTQFV